MRNRMSVQEIHQAATETGAYARRGSGVTNVRRLLRARLRSQEGHGIAGGQTPLSGLCRPRRSGARSSVEEQVALVGRAHRPFPRRDRRMEGEVDVEGRRDWYEQHVPSP